LSRSKLTTPISTLSGSHREFPEQRTFFVVNLNSDSQKERLTSRLYLFTYVLSRMKGVRSIVFTASRGDVARSFLGVALGRSAIIA
jgi:hypothetical protein